MHKGHVVLAALAMLMGFGTAFTVDAASYRDIGTVAEGVYLLHGDGAFKVQAVDPVTALVYDEEGRFLLAKAMGGGEARTFVVGEGAVAAILGGNAKVAARDGEGRMMPLETVRNVVELAENQGRIDESFSIRLPPFLVGVSGQVRGEADNLVVEVRSSKGLIYKFTEGSVETHLENLAAEVLDARITADRLDGRIVLEVHQPDMGGMDWSQLEARMARHAEEQAEHEKERERHHAEAKPHKTPKPPAAAAPPRTPRAPEAWEPMLGDLQGVPILLRFPAGGQLSLDIRGGSGIDLSLYDASGQQAQYLALGVSVAQERSGCRSFVSCFGGPMGSGYEFQELTPEVVEWALEPGDYLLYTRLAWAEAQLTFAGLGEHFEVEPVSVDGSTNDAAAAEFAGPVLDFWVWDWNPTVQSQVSAMLDGATFYEETSLVSLGGQALEHQVTYDPSLLGAGMVEVLRGGLNLPTHSGQYGILAAPPLSEVQERVRDR